MWAHGITPKEGLPNQRSWRYTTFFFLSVSWPFLMGLLIILKQGLWVVWGSRSTSQCCMWMDTWPLLLLNRMFLPRFELRRKRTDQTRQGSALCFHCLLLICTHSWWLGRLHGFSPARCLQILEFRSISSPTLFFSFFFQDCFRCSGSFGFYLILGSVQFLQKLVIAMPARCVANMKPTWRTTTWLGILSLQSMSVRSLAT